MKAHELQFYNRKGITISEYVDRLCEMTDSEFKEELKNIDKEFHDLFPWAKEKGHLIVNMKPK